MLRKLKELMFGDGHSLQERMFAIITLMLVLSFTVYTVINTVTRGADRNILIRAGLLVLLVIIAVVSLKRQRIRTGSILTSALLIFGLLPNIFISGGGIYGSAPIWFIFATLFVSLILSGKTRILFLLGEAAVAGICYAVAYYNPDYVSGSSTAAAFIDSFAMLVQIGVAISVTVAYEILLYRKENLRAEQQKREIQALNVSQSRFFSSMSHEIRTPINTIIGLNEMILREDVSDEVAEDAANIQAASKMLLHLINDILDMSKLESGSMRLTPVNYRLGDMLSELVGMFWGRAREKGLEFHVNVAPDVPSELYGDDVRIRQILINVLNNAVKYTREGSVTLSIQCGARSGSRQDLIFSVIDTGMGIKKENIPYLFTAFRRVDEESNRHIEGTGLGLAIVKQLVELMGGTISVNSIYTQGSTFIIQLPQQVTGEGTVGTVDTDLSHARNRAAYRARFEAPDADVLVVDDNASNLLVVSKLLRGTKVNVETAPSGEEALRMTQEKMYHVIFMDHMMPEMDGVECRRRILAQPGGKCRDSKIIALTANADSESRSLYEREGFDGYLTKPLEAAALENELARQLPAELVHFSEEQDGDVLEESVAWISGSERKRMVAITTESVADLPQEMIEQYGIATIPHLVITEQGVFRDTTDLESDGLLAYMADPASKVRTRAPDVHAHEAFFADQLKRANNVIHIVLSAGIGNSAYSAAMEASDSFNNVTVVDSGHLSSGLGLMVLEACRLAEEGLPPADIVGELEQLKPLIQTSFIVDNLDYLARAGQVGSTLAGFTKSLTMRPVLMLKKGKMAVGKVYLGSRRRAWKKYIEYVLCTPLSVDPQMLFITYSGISRQDLNWIISQVGESEVRFRNIFLQKAAPAISVNCGPVSFGLLFRNKAPE